MRIEHALADRTTHAVAGEELPRFCVEGMPYPQEVLLQVAASASNAADLSIERVLNFLRGFELVFVALDGLED